MASRGRAVDSREQVGESSPPAASTRAQDATVEPQPPLRFIASDVTKALFIVLPLTVAAVLVAFRFFPEDPMFATGLSAVVVGFLVFLGFGRRVPHAFGAVRLRRLVEDQDLARYREFEQETGRLLNAKRSVVFGLAFALVALARFPIGTGGFAPLLEGGPRGVPAWGILGLAGAAAEVLLGFVAGLAIWRMIVVGWRIHRLGESFTLRVQLGHPDRCGGFKPIGSVCLWNALILTVPGVFLGWWIVFGPVSQYGTRYVGLHSVLAAIVVLLATFAFVAPLLSIHGAMEHSVEAVRARIERRGQRIDELARELIERGDQLSPSEREARAKDLALWQELYARHQHLPTWPIDVDLAMKFVGAQAVPLLGLTGISKPLLDIVGRLTGFIGADPV